MKNFIFILSLVMLLSSIGFSDDSSLKRNYNNSQKTTKQKVAGKNNTSKMNKRRVVKKINGVEFAFRWCPAGTFMMGSPESEQGRQAFETQHEVTLTHGFWMMETELTQKQWTAIMGTTIKDQRDKVESSLPLNGVGDDYPMYYISWEDCQAFCKKSQQLGLPVSLPTEAQWEYACRAGTTGPFADEIDFMAWYGYYATPKGTCTSETAHPVGTKKANAWGLYDMHGNVWEWCADWCEYNIPSDSVTDPVGPSSGNNRVDRGGAWGDQARICRSASRGSDSPSCRDGLLGVRFIVNPQPVKGKKHKSH